MSAYDLPAWEDGDEVLYEEHRARMLALDEELLCTCCAVSVDEALACPSCGGVTVPALSERRGLS